MVQKILALLDVSNFIFRAFHAVNPNSFKRSDGLCTNAVHGVINILLKIKKELEPNDVTFVACMDSPKRLERREILEDYKQQRPPLPDDLKHQFEWVREAFQMLDIQIYVKPGYEADDIMATLANKYNTQFDETLLVTTDKDMLQLLTMKNVFVYNPQTHKYIYEEDVFEKYSVTPEQFTTYQSLIGDKVDNIPGIKGIGPKRAVKIIEEAKNMDEILKLAFDSKLASKVAPHIDQLTQNMELVRLNTEVDIEDLNTLPFTNASKPAFIDYLSRMELEALKKRLG